MILLGDVLGRIDDLFEAGCDDITFQGDNTTGTAYVDREALDAFTAIRSAIEDVEGAGLTVTEVQSDLVSITDISERAGKGFSTVSAWAAGTRGPGNFPTPKIETGRSSLYSWSEVCEWIVAAGLTGATDVDLELAKALTAMNALVALRPHINVLAEHHALEDFGLSYEAAALESSFEPEPVEDIAVSSIMERLRRIRTELGDPAYRQRAPISGRTPLTSGLLLDLLGDSLASEVGARSFQRTRDGVEFEMNWDLMARIVWSGQPKASHAYVQVIRRGQSDEEAIAEADEIEEVPVKLRGAIEAIARRKIKSRTPSEELQNR
ncbi:hypothetical protein [Actinomadura nitritigenes]|uniref:hypothetical protein n=1 Tax=Actinomadura nitritigenes TaxID=134602 RepID=UPI003D91E97E